MVVALTGTPQMTCVFGMPPNRARIHPQEDTSAWQPTCLLSSGRSVSSHPIASNFPVKFSVTASSYQTPCQGFPPEVTWPLAVNVSLDNLQLSLIVFSPPAKHKARVTFFQLFISIARQEDALIYSPSFRWVTPRTSCCRADGNRAPFS